MTANEPDREYGIRLPNGELLQQHIGTNMFGQSVFGGARVWSDYESAKHFADDLARNAAYALGVTNLGAAVVWRYVGQWSTDATAHLLVDEVSRFLESAGGES